MRGAGNCINMLSLQSEGRTPLLMLVSMRGEWGEFNGWELLRRRTTQPALEAQQVLVYRVEDRAQVAETVCAALAFHS